ncbi:MAG: hypothetical protein NC548_47380 [Lachnospiraceae bacterium]|nr:hypothetical protein [Lachnospiraceae bacterium]
MYRVVQSFESIMCMSNVRGKNVRCPSALPFSFYFSGKDGVSHGPRVKPLFNPDKMRIDLAGNLKLCDDWEYTPGRDDQNVGAKSIREMKSFFKVNIVLFCLVWDLHLYDTDVQDYLEGKCSLQDLIRDLDFYDQYKEDLGRITDVFELDNFCRDNNLVNFYGN